jgi:hypothetical protein
MIERDQLPEDAADWTGIVVDFPRLDDDSPQSCPLNESDVFDYVRVESADVDDADHGRFRFRRTALVRDQRFWLWEYMESDGVLDYVLVQADATGNTILGLSGTNGLSPEQYILASYYDEVYWS